MRIQNLASMMFVGLTLFGLGASAFSLQTSLTSLRPALNVVESKIPAQVKNSLPGIYTIAEERFGVTDVDVCAKSLDFDKLVRSDIIINRQRILLNPALVTAVKSGVKCAQATAEEIAVAAVIHEVGHLYDRSSWYWNNKVDQKEVATCQVQFPKKKNQYETPVSSVCDYYLNATYKISDSLNYRSLSDYKGIRQESKNELPGRILNPNELTSVHEHFALNFAQFLLDPTYQCRRPSLNTFFEKVTKAKAFLEGSCDPVTYLYTSAGGWKIDLDPKRVYQVHFLFAAKGEEIASRWGHSMIRLVTCAPERKTVGPECLQDTAYHIVLSYRANIDDVIVNYFDGLFGKYPSQLMTFAMSEVVDEYTRGQWRELISLPLNFTEAQKDLFVDSVLEHYWSYKGKYKFITNNCATEADQLVRAVLSKNHPYHSVSSASPLGMYGDLIRYGLIDPSLIADKTKARAQTYYYPSQKEALDKAFAKVQGDFPHHKDIQDFALHSRAEDRRLVYEQMQNFDEIGAAYLVEKYISLVGDRALQARLSKALQGEGVVNPRLTEAIEHLVAASQTRLPWKYATTGYGIPIAQETISDEEVTKRYRETSVWGAQYREELLRHFPELTQELNEVKQNMEILLNRRRF